MRWLLVLALMAAVPPRTSHADTAADARTAFQAFVDRVAAKQAPAGLDTFIVPGPGQDDDNAPPIGDLSATADSIGKPVKVIATGIATSGTAAWIAATLGSTRASAFLVKDAKGWHVVAAHWSAPHVENPAPGIGDHCGNVRVVLLTPRNVPDAAKPAVDALENAFYGHGMQKGSPLPPGALSDDKSAVMFGSAPKEQWSGGAAIKRVFKSWTIDLGPDSSFERAGIAPGGDLAWVTTPVTTNKLCKTYRAMFVLQKESSGWLIVHQHYSEPR